MPDQPFPDDNERYQQLAHKWAAGTLTPEERRELEDWYQRDQDQLVEVPSSVAMTEEEHERRLLAAIHRKIGWEAPVIPLRNYRRPLRWIAAAAIILVLLTGAYFLRRPGKEIAATPAAIAKYKGDVAPGHNGAILTLSNGQQILLDSTANGAVAKDGKVQLIRKDGQLIYKGTQDELVYNTVTTAKGRVWSISLPDGTRVWLNSASSIRYPLAFTGKDRTVEMTGEAYFEVVHNATQPFKVKVGDQYIEDIGTSFNVNGYTDENAVRTTLLEGAARVRTTDANNILRPGEQATVTTGSQTIRVQPGNIEEAIAWKQGFFNFQHADIKTVMRQLSRWYDVNVEYKVIPDDTFSGEMGRNLSLAQVLDILQTTHVHFMIKEDKTIIILP
jgi:ferric-dicitrate binding protein FerR (iron transport regulator)